MFSYKKYMKELLDQKKTDEQYRKDQQEKLEKELNYNKDSKLEKI